MARRRGFKWNQDKSRLELYANGTKAATWGYGSAAALPATELRTPTVDATATALTLTGAMLAGGIIEHDPAGGDATDTTATAAAIDAAIPGLAVGDAFVVHLINTADAAETITLAGGADVTINAQNALQTVTQNEAALLVFIKTATTPTYNCYILGA